MRTEIITCDISDEKKHEGVILSREIDVIFDHDQEDGMMKVVPYFHRCTLDICQSCMRKIFQQRRHVYGFGAMGHNTYYLNK